MLRLVITGVFVPHPRTAIVFLRFLPFFGNRTIVSTASDAVVALVGVGSAEPRAVGLHFIDSLAAFGEPDVGFPRNNFAADKRFRYMYIK